MEKIAVKVFLISSITFGFVGVIIAVTSSENSDGLYEGLLGRILGMLVFIILSSFAVSVAYKYLGANDK